MTEIKITQEELVKQCIDLFLENEVPLQLVKDWYEGGAKLGYSELREFVEANLKKELQHLSRMSVILGMSMLIDDSNVNNSNINFEEFYKIKSVQLNNMRRAGRTTRIANQVIEELFQTGNSTFRDHHDSNLANELLLRKIEIRLRLEHYIFLEKDCTVKRDLKNRIITISINK